MPLNLSVVSTVDILIFLSLHKMGSELVSDCVTYIYRRQPRVGANIKELLGLCLVQTFLY